MSSVSFTYNGDYDAANIVVMSQNGLDSENNPNSNLTLGPFYSDRYIVSSSGIYTPYGTYFIDAQRFDGDPQDQNQKIMTGSEYSINLDASDRIGFVYATGSNFGDILRAGSGADTLNGGGGNDILDGGAGADIFDGGAGNNTVTYEHAPDAVLVVLSDVGHYGEAEGDTYTNIQNVTGSNFSDFLQGDESSNILRGNGGSDALLGMGGDDRLVISGDATFTEGMGGPMLDGGADKDAIFFTKGELNSASVTLGSGSIGGIEQIYVRGGVHIDMSAVTEGQSITSQSTSGHHVEIIGTSGADRIQAGKGGDSIEGGQGGDKLIAGSGEDTFHFQANFGRDNVYKYMVGIDHFDVSALVSSFDQIHISAFHGGADALITFDGAAAGNKIILHDVAASSLHADDFGFVIT